MCIVGSSLLLYPGKNPIQSLFYIVLLPQFLYTLVVFFTVLCQIFVAPLKFSLVLSLILSNCFFYCVPFLFFLSLYSVGFATCKSIFLSFLLFLCPRDDSQGALRFAPVCPPGCLSVRPSVHSSRFTVLSLCNQPLSQFLMDLFETLHICCGHIEDVHVGFWWS